jgi:hypothetical protein
MYEGYVNSIVLDIREKTLSMWPINQIPILPSHHPWPGTYKKAWESILIPWLPIHGRLAWSSNLVHAVCPASKIYC